MEEYKLRIDENGNVSSEKEMSDRERASKLRDIRKLIDDPDVPPSVIKRMIAAELAEVNILMIQYGNDVSILEGMKIKALDSQVKALRELGKEVGEADVLNKKDILNLDGKKFRYVLDEHIEGLKSAMRTVKLDDTTINSILNHWRDIMQDKEQEIRRGIDKFDKK